MHKVRELEDKWFNYKMKKLVSPMMRLSAFSFLLAGSYYLYENKENMLLSLSPSNGMSNVLGVSLDANESMIKKENSLQKLLIKKLPIEDIVVKEEVIEEPKVIEKIALVPIIPVIDMEKEERISDIKRVKPVRVANTVAAKRNNYLTAKELAVMTKTQKRDEVIPRKTKKMNFTSTSSNYIETMEQKFSKSNSPRDALLLAKTYYKNANYEASEEWALRANKLNNSLEDSWLFFAKSKVKLGKKKEALKILVSYYKKSHSVKAKRLIGQIKTGKI